MPYYCTVPRCTSMAGKIKDVSFHQFPRDEQRAKLWNKILKRSKPYTKYSKVCSLHFKPEDYVLNSVGKNKGQWRTLRKDAIPSQNLPSTADVPNYKEDDTNSSVSSQSSNQIESVMQQQVAHAIYMQTMLAMHAALRQDTSSSSRASTDLQTDIQNPVNSTRVASECDENDDSPVSEEIESSNGDDEVDECDEIGKIDNIDMVEEVDKVDESNKDDATNKSDVNDEKCYFKVSSFKCIQCLKCFKDPDVLLLHQRSHHKSNNETDKSVDIDNCSNEKENFNSNCLKYEERSQQEILNPILANLLRSDANMNSHDNDETNDVATMCENQYIKAMFAVNLIKTLELPVKSSKEHQMNTITTKSDESKNDE